MTSTRRDLERAMHTTATGHLGRDPGRLVVIVGVGAGRHVAVYQHAGEWVHVTRDETGTNVTTRFTEAASLLLLNATVADWQGARTI